MHMNMFAGVDQEQYLSVESMSLFVDCSFDRVVLNPKVFKCNQSNTCSFTSDKAVQRKYNGRNYSAMQAKSFLDFKQLILGEITSKDHANFLANFDFDLLEEGETMQG